MSEADGLRQFKNILRHKTQENFAVCLTGKRHILKQLVEADTVGLEVISVVLELFAYLGTVNSDGLDLNMNGLYSVLAHARPFLRKLQEYFQSMASHEYLRHLSNAATVFEQLMQRF
eukprot:813743_1